VEEGGSFGTNIFIHISFSFLESRLNLENQLPRLHMCGVKIPWGLGGDPIYLFLFLLAGLNRGFIPKNLIPALPRSLEVP
jgi:hypothetical protein